MGRMCLVMGEGEAEIQLSSQRVQRPSDKRWLQVCKAEEVNTQPPITQPDVLSQG